VPDQQDVGGTGGRCERGLPVLDVGHAAPLSALPGARQTFPLRKPVFKPAKWMVR
jgi:hypothetical protein